MARLTASRRRLLFEWTLGLETQFIGPYKLREQIGEGGMGIVFVAEQEQPIRRKVALKIIKPGMDSKQVLARFEAERQALAMMDHPNIAKVFDAGTTDGGKGDRSNLCEAPSGPSRQIGPVPFSAGRPYFVMELVRGLPITEYCDNAKLPTRQRLELFITVCRAVQHAHLKGIIHRDIKPSNVLVTQIDGVAVPKIIDFGVAKATNKQLSEQTIYTQFAQMIGTPLYMSPEQAEMSGVDVDTRSDVYSLGVLLYELLTGMTPFDKETLKQVAFDEMRRMIREDEPPRPSDRLSTLTAEKLSTVSDRRAVDGRKLSQSLRGEVDWIVMKALEKDRNRRYESASALAADLERHLKDEPVEACPPSAGYRFSKFARRNKTAFVTTTLVAISLIAGTGISLWQAVRATKAERLAEQRLSDEKLARTEAERQRALADSRRQASSSNLLLMLKTSSIFSERFFLEEGVSDRLTRWESRAFKLSIRRHYRSVRFLRNRVDKFPNDPQVIFDLATTHAVLGICLARLGETEKVIVEIQRAIELIDEGNRYSDARTYRKVYLADYLGQILGRLFKKANRPDEAWGYSRPLGLTFGPHGNLFVGSRTLNWVLQFDVSQLDERGGRLGRVFARGDGLRSPNGLAFGPDGSLFVASSGTDAVLRYDGKSGRFIDTFVSRAGLRPNGLTFGPKNRLFVSSRAGMRGEVSSLYCFDTKTRAIVWSVDQDRIFTDVAYGPDGDLYVSCLYPDGVLRFDGETGKLIGPLVRQADDGGEAKE